MGAGVPGLHTWSPKLTHSPLSNIKAKNEWNHDSSPPSLPYMKVEKVDWFTDFPQRTDTDKLEGPSPSVTDGAWRYCLKRTDSVLPEGLAFQFMSVT
jgi:hypothetical protein